MNFFNYFLETHVLMTAKEICHFDSSGSLSVERLEIYTLINFVEISLSLVINTLTREFECFI